MQRRIKIAHVITRLILGGAQENTLLTAIGQHRNPDFDVTLIIGPETGPEGTLVDRAHAAGVRVIEVPTLIRAMRPVTDLRGLWDLYRLFRRENFDLVHTHSSKAGILGRVAARAARVPVVVHTLHSLVFHEYEAAWKNRLYIFMKRRCAGLADMILSVNDMTVKGALAARIGRPEQYLTVYSGMDLDPFLEIGSRLSPGAARQRLGIPPEAPVVGKIARLFPLKGHAEFLQAAALVAARSPATHFLLVGDGVLRSELERQAAHLGIADRVVFAGLVPPEQVPACIQAMDVVVHTSLREGIARVLPQGGACGKPVVAYDLDGAPEVLGPARSGYLVPARDTAAVADRVVELLDDPQLCAEMGARGRAFANAHFRVEIMVARINAVYYEILERKGLRAPAAAAAAARP